jgi:hypothetical protein
MPSGQNAAEPTKKLTTLDLIDQRNEIVRRYKFMCANFEDARQSEKVKTMGQKHKGRIDEAKSSLDEAYKKVRERLDELIEVGTALERAGAGGGN